MLPNSTGQVAQFTEKEIQAGTDNIGSSQFCGLCLQLDILLFYTVGVPQWQGLTFIFVMLSKLIDLVLIYYFYQYMTQTLGFHGLLANLAEKGIPVLMGIQSLIILSNIFYPVTFLVDQTGIRAVRHARQVLADFNLTRIFFCFLI